MDAASPRPTVVRGRAAEPVGDAVVLSGSREAVSSTASSTEGAPIDADAIRTTAPIQDAAAVEHTTRAETTPHTSRRTRSTAGAGVSLSEASADSSSAVASTPSRSAARRSRTGALEVAPVTPPATEPAPSVARPEPVMQLRQVDTTTAPALPTLGAAVTGSIAAVPVVDAPRRNRTRPAAGETVATPVPVAGSRPATPTAEPVADAHEPTATAERAVAAHDTSVTAAPPVDEHEPSVTAQGAFVAEPAADRASEEPHTVSPAGDDAPIDEFEAAARLFSFTGETPIQRPAESPAAESVAEETDGEPAHKAPRHTKKHTAGARRAAAASFSIGVMGIVGLLTVGMTTPAEAVAAAAGNANPGAIAPAGDVAINIAGGDSQDIQAYMAPTQAQTTALDRSIDYSTVTAAATAADTGIKNISNAFFTNDPNSPIQWPFAVGCTISWGFGPRPGEFHEGVDFTPGAGAHVQAIADGVVRVSTDNGGGYGVMIIIDHIIDGKLVSSRYGHMQYGSRQVQVGDHVHVGQYIGRTGNTGRSYGAHTHLEILMNGTTPIDPIPWLRAHVK